jgi:hypothetical protein
MVDGSGDIATVITQPEHKCHDFLLAEITRPDIHEGGTLCLQEEPQIYIEAVPVGIDRVAVPAFYRWKVNLKEFAD